MNSYEFDKTREGAKEEVVYNWKLISFEHQGTILLSVYKGKSLKRKGFYRFESEKKRQISIDIAKKQAEKEYQTKEAEKTNKKALKNAWTNPHKVGDIFASSWGYDQTNVDFYQIVEVKPKSLVFKEITQTQADDDFHVLPNKDDFKGEETKTIRASFLVNGDEVSVYYPASSYEHLRVWNGKPKYATPWHQYR